MYGVSTGSVALSPAFPAQATTLNSLQVVGTHYQQQQQQQQPNYQQIPQQQLSTLLLGMAKKNYLKFIEFSIPIFFI